ncbi:MAG: ribosome biogenesis GTP-binding protein YihA/YsxC [Saprospiraceae bacterium]|nr:ribosome biogenesis GTP-binding protein YihA/YsxC [Saprospiraceae bacterium]
MQIHTTEFIGSYPRENMCPKDGLPEFAFIGRSNVGKSSLINMLTGRKGLAKVSGTPGKTQLINFFKINNRWYLVDLPGYGYAKVSKTKLKELSLMIEGYLMRRQTLALAFILVDANVPPQKADLEFINAMGAANVPFALVFTKTDRLKPGQLAQHTATFFEALSETWETIPPHFITSSEYRTGREDILKFIEEVTASI